eukprot:2652076-Amphidinium_carterae.1
MQHQQALVAMTPTCCRKAYIPQNAHNMRTPEHTSRLAHMGPANTSLPTLVPEYALGVVCMCVCVKNSCSHHMCHHVLGLKQYLSIPTAANHHEM